MQRDLSALKINNLEWLVIENNDFERVHKNAIFVGGF